MKEEQAYPDVSLFPVIGGRGMAVAAIGSATASRM